MAYDPRYANQPAIPLDEMLKRAMTGSAAPISPHYGVGATRPTAIDPIAPVAPVTPITGNVKGPQPLQTGAPTAKNFAGSMGPKPKIALPAAPPGPLGALPNLGGLSAAPVSPIADVRPQVASLPATPTPGAGGYSPMAPGSDTYVREAATGSIEGRPQFRAEYAGPNGTMTVAGPSQRQGGGTVSFLSGVDPEQTAAAAQKVADYDRATEALRSLREARNPGVTGAKNNAPSLEAMQDAADPYNGRAYLFDSMTPGQKTAARSLQASARAKAGEQYADLAKAAQQQAGTLGAAQISARQKAQEATARDAIDRGRLNLDAAKLDATIPFENRVRDAQASKLAGDAAQQQRAASILDTLLKGAKPEPGASLPPMKADAYRDLLYKYGLLASGKAEPIDPNAWMTGGR